MTNPIHAAYAAGRSSHAAGLTYDDCPYGEVERVTKVGSLIYTEESQALRTAWHLGLRDAADAALVAAGKDLKPLGNYGSKRRRRRLAPALGAKQEEVYHEDSHPMHYD